MSTQKLSVKQARNTVSGNIMLKRVSQNDSQRELFWFEHWLLPRASHESEDMTEGQNEETPFTNSPGKHTQTSYTKVIFTFNWQHFLTSSSVTLTWQFDTAGTSQVDLTTLTMACLALLMCMQLTDWMRRYSGAEPSLKAFWEQNKIPKQGQPFNQSYYFAKSCRFTFFLQFSLACCGVHIPTELTLKFRREATWWSSLSANSISAESYLSVFKDTSSSHLLKCVFLWLKCPSVLWNLC